MSTPTRVAIYLRTSHVDRTIQNQRLELQRVAAQRGWEIVAEFKDEAISGAKGRDKRPGFDAALKGAMRRDFDMLAAWSVDRLGRSISGLVDTMEELNHAGCALYLHQQSLDTASPSGRAMFQMLGVFAEFEREMIKARITAGLQRRLAAGHKLGKRATSARKAALARARVLRAEGRRWGDIAVAVGVPVGSLRRGLSEGLDAPDFLS